MQASLTFTLNETDAVTVICVKCGRQVMQLPGARIAQGLHGHGLFDIDRERLLSHACVRHEFARPASITDDVTAPAPAPAPAEEGCVA